MNQGFSKAATVASALVASVVAGIFWYQFLRYGGAERLREVDTAMAITHNGNRLEGYNKILTVGCGACHVIPGIPGAAGKIGPPLTGIKDRAMIAGRLANKPDNLISWIKDPHQIDPATAMPDLGLTEAEARDIAAYLYSPQHE